METKITVWLKHVRLQTPSFFFKLINKMVILIYKMTEIVRAVIGQRTYGLLLLLAIILLKQ